MVRIQPGFERTEFFLQFQNATGIEDSSIHLEFIADNARIRQQSFAVGLAVACHRFDIESIVCKTEVVGFFKNGDP